jgi:hypothetical protein
MISGIVFYPVIGIRMQCAECGGGFLTSRDGSEANHWEPITERTVLVTRADSA